MSFVSNLWKIIDGPGTPPSYQPDLSLSLFRGSRKSLSARLARLSAAVVADRPSDWSPLVTVSPFGTKHNKPCYLLTFLKDFFLLDWKCKINGKRSYPRILEVFHDFMSILEAFHLYSRLRSKKLLYQLQKWVCLKIREALPTKTHQLKWLIWVTFASWNIRFQIGGFPTFWRSRVREKTSDQGIYTQWISVRARPIAVAWWEQRVLDLPSIDAFSQIILAEVSRYSHRYCMTF